MLRLGVVKTWLISNNIYANDINDWALWTQIYIARISYNESLPYLFV